MVALFLIGKERPKLAELSCRVSPYWAARWRQLGTELKVKQSQMEIIDADHPRDCLRCCNEMFSVWLDSNHTATWNNVLNATAKLFYVPGKYLCTFIKMH